MEQIMNLESREAVIENLKDAGCNPDAIEKFLLYFDKGQKEKQLELLEVHRKQLLNKVHQEEKRICCLDYLIYQIEK